MWTYNFGIHQCTEGRGYVSTWGDNWEKRQRRGGPDLIFHHPSRSTFLLDVTTVADNAVLPEVHERKVQYYDVPDIRNWITRNISDSQVHFSSVTLSWRGLMAHASAETSCSRPALGRPLLSLLSAVTCERSLWIWQHFHRSNFVLRGWRGHTCPDSHCAPSSDTTGLSFPEKKKHSIFIAQDRTCNVIYVRTAWA